VAKVTKLFQRNCATIGVISVNFTRKYAASSVNYAKKSFIIFVPAHNSIKLFSLFVTKASHTLAKFVGKMVTILQSDHGTFILLGLNEADTFEFSSILIY
jgi:hypothetical protein